MVVGNAPVTSPKVARWTVLAMTAAPACAVLLMRVIAPIQGPAAAKAGTVTNDAQAPLVVPPVFEPTPAQIELAAVMHEEARRPFGPSPVITRKREGEPATEPMPLPSDQEAPAGPMPPDASVTSIMVAQGQPMAVIDGAVRRVGDTVAPGWTVTAISRDEGSVTLTHTRGDVHRLVLRQRGGR